MIEISSWRKLYYKGHSTCRPNNVSHPKRHRALFTTQWTPWLKRGLSWPPNFLKIRSNDFLTGKVKSNKFANWIQFTLKPQKTLKGNQSSTTQWKNMRNAYTLSKVRGPWLSSIDFYLRWHSSQSTLSSIQFNRSTSRLSRTLSSKWWHSCTRWGTCSPRRRPVSPYLMMTTLSTNWKSALKWADTLIK